MLSFQLGANVDPCIFTILFPDATPKFISLMLFPDAISLRNSLMRIPDAIP